MQVSTQGDDDQTKDSTTWFCSAPVNYYIDLRHRLITSATNYCRCCRMRRPPAAGAPLRASSTQPYASVVPRPSQDDAWSPPPGGGAPPPRGGAPPPGGGAPPTPCGGAPPPWRSRRRALECSHRSPSV